MSMKPVDEIAVEEAIALKEKASPRNHRAVRGVTACQETIRTALAWRDAGSCETDVR